MERGLYADDPNLLRTGRGRCVPHRHAFAFALDAAHRARFRTGRYARRLATGRGTDAAVCGVHNLRIALTASSLYGWRMAFVAFGFWGWCGPGVWFSYYRDTPEEHRGVNAAERKLIGRAQTFHRSVPWRQILRHGNLWVLSVMYFCYNFNLNVYNDWFPTYLHDSRGMTLARWALCQSAIICRDARGSVPVDGSPIAC